ncbi:MAG: lamin tail domain-containing protein [Deltaproteobacteria bacterium]|nr:lamin tail domain-containing protein [Deltaproteobacteria bacterium]
MKGENMNRKGVIRTLAITVGAAVTIVASSQAWAAPAVSITEWMYNGDEFIEFTNTSVSAIDFTGWSFDDDSRTPGTVSLSGFGWVDAGESVLLTESSADAFRTAWNLVASVKIVGGNGANLGRNDEINIFNNSGILVDRLAYGDQTFSGTIRTQNVSGNPVDFAALGVNNPAQWVLASTGDVYGSYASANGDIGNPGINPFSAAPVPVPAAAWLLGSGLIGLAGLRRRKA